MDPLALLSNLHGDGPATLHRLRKHGCETLSCLLGQEAEALSLALGWEAVRAERFLREARILAGRLGEGLLDHEEEPCAHQPARLEAPHSLAAASAAGAGAEDDEAADAEQVETEAAEADAEVDAEALPMALREEVVSRWRELDRNGVPAAAIASDVLVPRAPPAQLPARRPLAEAAIDGLDPVRVKALSSAGIQSVEDLAGADDLDLHQRTGIAFGVVSRLVFLARRAAQSAPQPPRRNGRFDAAGPFA